MDDAQRQGNAQTLRDYWSHGKGAAQIGWGSTGDYDRCVRLVSAHAEGMRDPHGYCAERHHEALGYWPATHAKMGKASRTMSDGTYDPDGLDASWDDPSGLPDLAGLGVEHFSAADGGGDSETSRAAKLGTGARFAALKGELAAKGASDPGALAAWIGRKRYGKKKFQGLAAAARKSAGAGAASRAVSAEIFRYYPLEDCQIVTRARGDSSGTLVEAYATVFDTPAEIRDHQGHYTEVIDRAAFDDTLNRIRRSRGGFASHVKVLYNHGKTASGSDAAEYQVPLGVPEEILPERRGLLTRTRYDAGDPFTERILAKIKSGAINAQSFVGAIMRSDPALLGPGDRYRRRGGALTTVRRMQLGLREYGPVLWPAYSGAEILGVRMQLPGDPDLVRYDEDPGPDTPGDDEYAPSMAGAVTGAAPEETDTSRYHQHALYRIRSQEIRERLGLEWED
jgi:phage head maturation protease